jgi:hypothetical protein
VDTRLRYSGARAGRIGDKVDVSVRLTTSNGIFIPGEPIVFKRAGASVTDDTADNGKAKGRLGVLDPKGCRKPLVVKYEGSDAYESARIRVPFSAYEEKKDKKDCD